MLQMGTGIGFKWFLTALCNPCPNLLPKTFELSQGFPVWLRQAKLTSEACYIMGYNVGLSECVFSRVRA
jgi:hypothetical protein